MSTYKAEVVKITPDMMKKHPNADSLSIVHVKGWDCVVKTSDFPDVQWNSNQLAVYIPIDMILPSIPKWEFLKARKYRIKTIKLRGELSQGLLIPAEPNWKEGRDVTKEIGVVKYEPPEPINMIQEGKRPEFKGNMWQRFYKKWKWIITAWLNELMHGKQNFNEPDAMRYHSDIERIQNFPDSIPNGIPVFMIEKIHGTNARYCLVGDNFFVASHYMIKRYPGGTSIYSTMADKYDIKNRMKKVFKGYNDIIIYGEIYGKKVQKLTYGLQTQELVLFDVQINGKFVNYSEVLMYSEALGIPVPPTIYHGPFSMEETVKNSVGMTVLGKEAHVREGIVIRPEIETYAKELPSNRMWAKRINNDYLLSEH